MVRGEDHFNVNAASLEADSAVAGSYDISSPGIDTTIGISGKPAHSCVWW